MSLASCIIESRPLPNLVQIIREHLKFLPANTKLILYCSPANYTMLTEAFPRAATAVMPDEICCKNMESYNKLLTTPKFWEMLLPWDRCLIFQHDSRILRKGIEEFYPYSYIGAPWIWDKEDLAGNGGFSLRDPKIMLEICTKFERPHGLNEDLWFCKMMKEHNIGQVAPREIADTFSCETIFKLGTFGYHAISSWMNHQDCEQIKNQYQ